MGWGDEIIASGQAKRNAQRNPAVRTLIRDRRGMLRVHEAWKNNPRIVLPSDKLLNRRDIIMIVNGPGIRPYIDRKTERQWFWKEWECPVGEIYLDDDEKAFASKFSPDVIIEPFLKAKASPNKSWGLQRWTALVEILLREGLRVAQMGMESQQLLPGVERIVTPTMRHACAVLSRSKYAILPEGGLHHAAAALGVPSAVIFGGFISPRQTGYASQQNFFTGGEPCGLRVPCKHCVAAMSRIYPEELAETALQSFRAAIA